MRKLLTGSFLLFALAATPIVLTEGSAQAQLGVRIQVAPPAPRVEVIPVAPSPRHVWIPGHWQWNGHQHVWVAGYHDLPPQPGYRWLPARWVNERGFWVYRTGHWAPNGVTVMQEEPVPPPGPVQEEVNVETAPPPPQEEVVQAAPPGQFWVGGHWRWDPMVRRHVWMGGHFEATRAGYYWVPAHWARGWRGYQFVPGHWRR